MSRQSGALGVGTSALARLNVVPHRPATHRVAILGDSRAECVFADIGTKRLLGSLSPFNWANALLGQRLQIAAALGVSGERTDQVMARLAQAIASGAGLLYLHAGVNDIAQLYPTGGTSGATAAANLIAMARQARAAGLQVVIELEVGSGYLGAAQVVQVAELNARLMAFARQADGVSLHDARPAVLDPGAAETALTYRAGMSYDLTHPSTRGAQAWGRSLAALIGTFVPPRGPALPATRADAPINGRWQLVRNPLFLDTTGGVAGNGASGQVPSNWEARASSGATMTVAAGPSPQGPGNRVSAQANFAAAGQTASMIANIGTQNAVAGEMVQGLAEVTITDAAALSGLFVLIEHYTGIGGISNAVAGLRPLTGGGHVGPVAGDRLVLATPPYVVQPNVGANAYLSLLVRAEASGAGTAAFALDRAAVVRL